jgi:dTDP-4-dehydrorhamnose 3,5-epimerase
LRFSETPLKGVFAIDVEKREDERGFFARTYCRHELEEYGLNPCIAQCSVSFNKKKGTLRGMHFQAPPYAEVKVVRCTAGAIYDVALDLRPDSPTFKQWFAAELTAENRKALYIPAGFAHGFQTLADDSEVFYQIGEFYHPDSARGVRWNDPAFGIRWPFPEEPILAPKDRAYADYSG